MGPRPTHLNLNDRSDLPQPPRRNFHADLPSPRAGEAPPALSPLDAFALHSRILAKQFEQERNGRRLSRLPHMTVAKELGSRPDYFRSTSGGSESAMSTMSEVPEILEEENHNTQGEPTFARGDEYNRPKSFYPMMGHASKPSEDMPTATPYFDAEETQGKPSGQQDYFGISVPRAASPEPVDPKLNVEAPSPNVPSLTNSMDTIQSTQPRTLTNGSTRSQRSMRSERGGLLPPKSPAHPKSQRSMQSIRSVRQDSGDEDGSSYNGAYAVSSSRKFSGSSNMSRPHSPFSPYMPPMHRSPSMTSEYSMNGSLAPLEKPRAPFNFSRPRSSGGQSLVDLRPSFDTRPSFDGRPEVLSRQTSAGSTNTLPSTYRTNPSTRQNSADDVRPMNIHIDTPAAAAEFPGGDYFPQSRPKPGQSYTYTKYSLPRGKVVDRDSAGLRESWLQRQFTWDEQKPPSTAPARDNVPVATDTEVFHQRQREDSDLSTLSAPVRRPASPTSSTGFEKISGMRLSRSNLALSSAHRSHSANPDSRVPENPVLHRSSPSVQTESTDRTIRATPLHQRAASAELTAEEHLEIGIQNHTSGNLSKSTYHLRLASKAGLPTAMLLYALACRHGWGMRPNQEEGVMWLRKAIEGSGLDTSNIEETVSATRSTPNPDPVAEAQERKKRKAQFALAIYELGISYMNGWGCSKDKALALRCYEVAGNWGDPDALAEAGFCYAQGQGCKKDLKKAAGLYRKAAEGGMSMAGNSWIYKPKYMDEAPPANSKSSENDKKACTHTSNEAAKEKPAGRSRARSIWGRKKEKA